MAELLRRVPSSVFRLTYGQLEEPVAVTTDGRVTGYYAPVSTAIDERFIAAIRPGEPASRPGQEPTADGSPLRGGIPGPTEAPDLEPAAPVASPAGVVGAPSGRQPAGLKPGMTQAERDRVLRSVAGKSPGKGNK